MDGQLNISEVPDPIAYDGHLIVANHFSLISPGTELSNISIGKKSIFKKAFSRPDDFKLFLKKAKDKGLIKAYKSAKLNLEKPKTLGYSSSGTVVAVGSNVTDFKIGDRVSCGGCGHAELIEVPKHLCVRIEDNVDFQEGAFITLASIALPGIRKANLSLGENVMVLGLGLIGQITMDIVRLSGCNPVGIDILDERVKFARSMGKKAFNRSDKSLKNKINSLTDGIGFDSVIIAAATSSSDPIEFASGFIRERGKMVIVGDVKLQLSRKNFYDKEIDFSVSKSYGPGRYDDNYEKKGRDYPVGFVRWTENRNMVSISKFLSEKRLSFKSYISSVFDFFQYEKAYEFSKRPDVFGTLFRYEISDQDYNSKSVLNYGLKTPSSLSKINVGLIGAGNFSQNNIIPLISNNNKINLRGICTRTGLNADFIGKKHNFEFSTTVPSEIFKDDLTDVIFIASPHETHGNLIIEGLKRNKHLFVEKPLTIDRKEIDDICNAFENSEGTITMGYNRRFSKHIINAVKFLKNRSAPISLNYTINARKLEDTHHLHDSERGGGRIVGEFCHFVDLSNYLIGEKYVEIKANKLRSINLESNNDTFSCIISYSDGSIANLSYFSNGNSSYPKETLEIFNEEQIVKVRQFVEKPELEKANEMLGVTVELNGDGEREREKSVDIRVCVSFV